MKPYDSLIHDIVKSKGYKTYIDWCYGKKTVSDFVDSINDKISQDSRSREPLKSENPEKSVFLQKQFEF